MQPVKLFASVWSAEGLPEHHDEYTVAQRMGDIVIVVRSSGICEENRRAWAVGRYPVMVSLEADIAAIKATRQRPREMERSG